MKFHETTIYCDIYAIRSVYMVCCEWYDEHMTAHATDGLRGWGDVLAHPHMRVIESLRVCSWYKNRVSCVCGVVKVF